MRGGSRRAAARGTVAVEFALVLPMFLLVLFGTVNVGRYLLARFQMLTLASETARVCSTLLPASQAGVQACAGQYFASKMSSYPSLQTLCSGLSVNPQSTQLTAAPSAVQTMVLQVDVACPVIFTPLAGLPLVGAVNFGPYVLRETAGMPYLLPQATGH